MLKPYPASRWLDLFFWHGRAWWSNPGGLTRPRISDRWRGRSWLEFECGSNRNRERGAASGSLYRLVRLERGSYLDQRGVETGGEVERPANTATKSKA